MGICFWSVLWYRWGIQSMITRQTWVGHWDFWVGAGGAHRAKPYESNSYPSPPSPTQQKAGLFEYALWSRAWLWSISCLTLLCGDKTRGAVRGAEQADGFAILGRGVTFAIEVAVQQRGAAEEPDDHRDTVPPVVHNINVSVIIRQQVLGLQPPPSLTGTEPPWNCSYLCTL